MVVVFLTGHGDVASGVQAMKGGARDFLLKPVREDALLEALAESVAALDELLRRDEDVRCLRARLATLTPREREVIGLAAEGLRGREIAGWLGIRLQTVKVHRMRAMAKLGVVSSTQLSEVWHRLETRVGPDGVPRTLLQPA
jgi:FixJ family two-component response regulator